MKEKCSEVKSYRIKFQFYPGPYKLDDINNSWARILLFILVLPSQKAG